jgi:hypothetical protein
MLQDMDDIQRFKMVLQDLQDAMNNLLQQKSAESGTHGSLASKKRQINEVTTPLMQSRPLPPSLECKQIWKKSRKTF